MSVDATHATEASNGEAPEIDVAEIRRRRLKREHAQATRRAAREKKRLAEAEWEHAWSHAADSADVTGLPLPLIDDALSVLRAREHLAQLYAEAKKNARDAARRAEWAWQVWAFFSGATTLLAATAAVTVIADSYPWITGVTAGVAALISGLQTSFNPRAASQRRRAETIAWSELAYDVRLWLLFCIAGDSPDQIEKSYRDFVRRSFELSRQYKLTSDAGPGPTPTGPGPGPTPVAAQ